LTQAEDKNYTPRAEESDSDSETKDGVREPLLDVLRKELGGWEWSSIAD
jgi:hypothetical protein